MTSRRQTADQPNIPMKDTIIRVENLSKLYRLGEVGTGTLSHDLNRWWAKLRGREDPFVKLGETNDRTVKGGSDYAWALRNVNFEVMRGEVLGVIGRNGAGKSTLLKILSKVTQPTEGAIKAKGRIASLLEVGTGFHPELTGKENIFLNGAIMGMTKPEIKRKFDEIVDFAGVGRYIDTPVKRYSSGMYVRLAFAVAAHLEPEILIVDEVLAVGDVEFQKKCLGKMKDVSAKDGRTVLFVSHNMTAISVLCDNLIILKNGTLDFAGTTEAGLARYMNSEDKAVSESDLLQAINQQDDDVLKLLAIELSQENSDGYHFNSSERIRVKFKYQVKVETVGLRIGFDLVNKDSDITIFRTFHDDAAKDLNRFQPGIFTSELYIEGNLLKDGNYLLSLTIGIHNIRWIINDNLKVNFSVSNIKGLNSSYADSRPGVIMPYLEWKTNKTIHE